jgi:dTDP-4-dehydrorhamnose reductase
MNVIVLGANGMAGHMISKYLSSRGFNVTEVTREQTNFENKDQIDRWFNNLKDADYVINCIGLLVSESTENPDKAITLNGWLPHYLEVLFSKQSTRLIHLSTDCVFDGKKGNYVEEDLHTETNFYGKSKSIGEINNDKDITFRMSIIGPEIKDSGTGLFHWFVNKAPDTVDGWDNAMWNGITTLQLAKCIITHMLNPGQTGVVHLVSNTNRISKYDLLKKINKIFSVGKTVNKVSGPKTVDKCLINTKKACNIPDYDTQLHELKQFIQTV